MSSDAGNRLPELPQEDFEMPKVLDIKIRATMFKAPRHRNFKSSLRSSDDAVEARADRFQSASTALTAHLPKIRSV